MIKCEQVIISVFFVSFRKAAYSICEKMQFLYSVVFAN